MALQWRGRRRCSRADHGAFGIWILFVTVRHAMAGTVPDAPVMGVVAWWRCLPTSR